MTIARKDFGSDREYAIALLRAHADTLGAVAGFRALHSAMYALLQEHCTRFDVQGVRYWEHPESDSRFCTMPGDSLSAISHAPDTFIELSRASYMGRNGIHFSYDEDRL
jgi:hypothetical protein